MTEPGALSPSLQQLRDQLLAAREDQRHVCVDGNHSKAFYGQPDNEGELLSILKHTGIIQYDPAELVITARAGTPLQEIEATLAKQGQMLACEPPAFGDATLGGMLGAGLSGPRRPYAGSLSDQVLGCRIMNGRGDVLGFGGRVMKNVAGYDLSRLMVGSMGCLGIILEATLKVVPMPAGELTLRFGVEEQGVAAFINLLRRNSLPVTASSHDGEWLRVRFSGGDSELAALPSQLDRLTGFVDRKAEDQDDYWLQLKEHKLPFFSAQRNLWRLSVPAATKPLPVPGTGLIEWGGALRWLASDAPANDIFELAARHGGHATLFRADSYRGADVTRRFQPLQPALLSWHKSLKAAFDPDNLLNVGRMYPEF